MVFKNLVVTQSVCGLKVSQRRLESSTPFRVFESKTSQTLYVYGILFGSRHSVNYNNQTLERYIKGSEIHQVEGDMIEVVKVGTTVVSRTLRSRFSTPTINYVLSEEDTIELSSIVVYDKCLIRYICDAAIRKSNEPLSIETRDEARVFCPLSCDSLKLLAWGKSYISGSSKRGKKKVDSIVKSISASLHDYARISGIACERNIKIMCDSDKTSCRLVAVNDCSVDVQGEVGNEMKVHRETIEETFNLSPQSPQGNTSRFVCAIVSRNNMIGQVSQTLIPQEVSFFQQLEEDENDSQLQMILDMSRVLADSQDPMFAKRPTEKRKISGDVYCKDEKLPEACSSSGSHCTICLENIPRVVLVPCGHTVACRECGEDIREKISECPICRSVYESVVIPFNPALDAMTDALRKKQKIK